MRSAWKVVLIIALSALAFQSASAGLRPAYDKEYLMLSEHGMVGIGQRTDVDLLLGLGTAGESPTMSVIDVYFGDALKVTLRGSLAFWLWAGPGLLVILLISFGVAWVSRKEARPLVAVLFFAFCGSVFGLFLTFLGSGIWLPTLPVIAGSPFAFLDLKLGWLFWAIIGGTLPLRRFRWARRLLVTMMLLHIASILLGSIAGSLFMMESTEALNLAIWTDVFALMIFATPVAFCLSLFMYLAAQALVWREIFGRTNPWCYRPGFAIALLPILFGCVAISLISEFVRLALGIYV